MPQPGGETLLPCFRRYFLVQHLAKVCMHGKPEAGVGGCGAEVELGEFVAEGGGVCGWADALMVETEVEEGIGGAAEGAPAYGFGAEVWDNAVDCAQRLEFAAH